MVLMKKQFAMTVFLWILLFSLASISFASLSSIQTSAMLARVNLIAPKPTVDILYPREGDLLESGLHCIDFLVVDLRVVAIVKLKIDGPESTGGWVEITGSRLGRHYYYNWSVGTEGSYSITVRATNGDNIQESDAVIVKVVSVHSEPVHDVAVNSVDVSPTSVEAGENVSVTVVVENQGDYTETFDVASYCGPVPIGTQTVTGLVAGASETLTFAWTTKDVVEGEYAMKAEAGVVLGERDVTDNSLLDCTVTVTASQVPARITHELFVEIDYMPGHMPTSLVLEYVHDYYYALGISVKFYVDDIVPLDWSVSAADFWGFEAQYNDNDYGFDSKWKWVLFGTRVSGDPYVVGYATVIIQGSDILCGNYIFIADTTADRWSSEKEIETYGAEAVVLLHEIGHSIGIAKLDSDRREVYDPDPYGVMSYLSTANAGLYWTWYYSEEYWNTRNIEYYTINNPRKRIPISFAIR